ncbi:LamG domain-containing protein [Candidatus Pacearchaeota archaeon]|nr:LamG domain-containing protein [Candidatus Pacearchaeota archaeon]
MSNKKFLVLASLLLIFGLINVSAFSISFVSPTPANATSTTSTNAEINISITNASDLGTFIWNWNNANYTFYDRSLVLMLNFDNASAMGDNETYAVDASAYGNNGTFGNSTTSKPNWTTSGRYGRALQFDAIDDYVNVSNSNSLDITDALTVEAWVKRAVNSNDSKYIVSKQHVGSEIAFAVGLSKWGILNVSWTWTSAGLYLADNNWHHIVATYDKSLSSDNMKFYQDGLLTGNRTYTGGLPSYIGEVYIGIDYDALQNGFNGTIDEVRIWNRSLSVSEIQQHYYSNFYKYAADKWAFYSYQQNLAAGTYTFQGFIRDIIGNLNQTEIRTIIITSISEIGDYDSDSCLEWSETRYCASGMACSGGSCKPACSESWACGEWGACENGKKERACTDANNCGAENNKPEETLSCLGAARPVMLPLADNLWIILLALIIAVTIVFSLLLSRQAKKERKGKRAIAYRMR